MPSESSALTLFSALRDISQGAGQAAEASKTQGYSTQQVPGRVLNGIDLEIVLTKITSAANNLAKLKQPLQSSLLELGANQWQVSKMLPKWGKAENLDHKLIIEALSVAQDNVSQLYASTIAAKNAEILSSLPTRCLYMSGQLSIPCPKLVTKQPVSNPCHGEEPGQQPEAGLTQELKGTRLPAQGSVQGLR